MIGMECTFYIAFVCSSSSPKEKPTTAKNISFDCILPSVLTSTYSLLVHFVRSIITSFILTSDPAAKRTLLSLGRHKSGGQTGRVRRRSTVQRSLHPLWLATLWQLRRIAIDGEEIRSDGRFSSSLRLDIDPMSHSQITAPTVLSTTLPLIWLGKGFCWICGVCVCLQAKSVC